MKIPTDAPETIYLQWAGTDKPESDVDFDDADVCWCRDRIFESDLEYRLVKRSKK